ncbi:MAG TPA: hypothetical protein VFH51_03095 [Myxococcota bacterium]|nr:hypothetical protein [Myxococcota bacterium]
MEQAKVIIAWAEPALGIEPTSRVRQRLDTAIQVFVSAYAQVFARAELNLPEDGTLLTRLEGAAAQLEARDVSEGGEHRDVVCPPK